jgi:hypothetical protein
MILRIWPGWTNLANADPYEAAVVPPKARALLARFDQRSQHYELRLQVPAA